jgi:tRNA A-37 threonylcarbamoyl transferase component Bud32
MTSAGGAEDIDRTRVSTGQWSIGSLPGRAMDGADMAGEAMPAKEVGRYRILAKLGEGAMATVYRAHDPGIDRELVLKFLRTDLCAVAEYRARFLREARAAGMLAHPNIVTVYDVGEIEGRPYIAMELLNGGPLSDKLVPGQGMPIRTVLRIGMQIANALDYAHGKGIFHRDVKPSNIIAVEDGRTFKIADFGIAQIESVAAAERTRVGTVVGTPHYMSPEQAMGTRVDGRADIFSVGVLLYQLLTGVRPFEGNSMLTLVSRIAKEDAKPVTDLRKDCPAALRRIVERCLAKAPEARFQTGRELADGLAKVWRDIDSAADSSGHPRRMPLKVKLAIGMTALVAATMAVTSAYVTHRQYQTMRKQVVEQGASLTKLIAVESAALALAEDWVGIDVLVQEVRRELDLDAVAVLDRGGEVRVSSLEGAVGKRLPPAKGEPIPAGTTGVAVHRAEGAGGAPVFAFEAPITFQSTAVGQVYLTLPEEPLAAATRESWLLLLLLLVTTAATVGLATYLLVERYGKPLQLLRESMREIAMGRTAYRIRETRDDEFGEVFRAFDDMAEQLDRNVQSAQAGASPTPSAGAAGAEQR